MVSIHSFVFNPFQVNTYLLYDDTRECLIIDPGCAESVEQEHLVSFIEKNRLHPVKMVFTHGHFDHLCGSKFIHDRYGITPICHQDEVSIIRAAPAHGTIFGFNVAPPPGPGHLVEEGDPVTFGNSRLRVLHTPGHSPGSISLFDAAGKYVLVGDVLFSGSIGRTDLPGGSYDVLMDSIHRKLMPLGDEVLVHPGHGPKTSIGSEKHSNPFIEKSLL